MAPLVAALVLGSALLHATWNALLRSGADRLASITVMSVMSGAAAAIACLVLPLPAPAAWPVVVLSAALQIAFRRRWPPIRRDRETLKALMGGVLSLIGYGVVVWAMSTSQMARVSGLRETSILFAAAIGVVFLKEPLSARRIACALLIAAGV